MSELHQDCYGGISRPSELVDAWPVEDSPEHPTRAQVFEEFRLTALRMRPATFEFNDYMRRLDLREILLSARACAQTIRADECPLYMTYMSEGKRHLVSRTGFDGSFTEPQVRTIQLKPEFQNLL